MAGRNQVEMPDLTGRRAVVTGASDGIGLRIAAHLAGAGAEVVLPVRNQEKGWVAVETIRERHPEARLVLESLDLSSLESVAALGERLRADGSPVHLLVNNAGVMTPPDRRTTSDGFELQWGTNHLGHAALVGHLLPLLRAGQGRVTSQTSVAARNASINWDDLNWDRSYEGMRAYGQSKLANALFGLELQRRSDAGGWGITSNLSHPGVAPTGLLSARPEMGRSRDTTSVRLIRLLSRVGLTGTVETAPMPAVLAATAPDAGGRFYGPRGPGQVGGAPAEQSLWKPMQDGEEAARLWSVTEELTGVRLDPVG